MPSARGEAIPPDLPVLFWEIIVAPSKKPLGWNCRDLLSAMLQSFRNNPFLFAAEPNRGVIHRRFAYSVQGLYKEGGNEDRYRTCHHGPATLLLVADGVSTADIGSGALAAEEVMRLLDFGYEDRFQEAVQACMTDPGAWPGAAERFLTGLFAEANERVVQRINELVLARQIAPQPSKAPQSPMCSTLTAAFIFGDQVVIYYVGDSPAWLFSPSRNLFCKLTGEHHAGQERPFSVQPVEQAKALTRVIGACEPALEGVEFVVVDQAPDTRRAELRRGDLLMLASDGLVDGIDALGPHERVVRFEAEVRQLNQSEKDLKKLVRRLVALAEDGLSNDNITLNALWIEKTEQSHG